MSLTQIDYGSRDFIPFSRTLLRHMKILTKKLRSKRGFTLVELIIVMAITSIVLTMVITLTVAIARMVADAKLTELREHEVNITKSYIESWYYNNYDPKTCTLEIDNTADYSALKISQEGKTVTYIRFYYMEKKLVVGGGKSAAIFKETLTYGQIIDLRFSTHQVNDVTDIKAALSLNGKEDIYRFLFTSRLTP